MAGSKLEVGTVVVLSLDGTMVYVEVVEPMFNGVVALPDQPTARADDRVFTPGRVGLKKISPMASHDRVVPIAELSERNREFIGTYEQLRAQHGNNYVQRTPEEQAAVDAAAAGPAPKVKKPKPTPEEKAAAKAAKKAAKGPRFLQRCATCNEQPGHPNHGTTDGLHEFVPPAPPEILCVACDCPESDGVHTIVVDETTGKKAGHRFMPGKPGRKPKEPKAPREPKPKAPKVARGIAATKPSTTRDQKVRWVGTDENLALVASMNPKFQAKNTGGAIVQFIRDLGEASQADVSEKLDGIGKGVLPARLELAFTQLLMAKLIEVVA